MQRYPKSSGKVSSLLEYFPEMQYILFKDIPNRVEKYQACLYIFPRCSISYAKIAYLFLFCKFFAFLSHYRNY